MTHKKKILVFVEWFVPAFKAGGPVKSVSNLINALHTKFDFYVITSDRDFGDKEAFSSIPENTWIGTSTYRVMYLSPMFRTVMTYQKVMNEVKPDILYFNSLFSFNFTLLPLWVARTSNATKVLAPRGMLVLKHPYEMFFPEQIGCLRRWRVIVDGDTSLSFYERI